MNLERTNEILSNWEEIDFRLFVKAVNKKRLKDNVANMKLTNDIYLQLSICLNDEGASDGELIQAAVPWKYLEYTSGGLSRSDILRIAMDNTLSMFPPVCNELPKNPLDIIGFESLEFQKFMDPGVVICNPETYLVVSNAASLNGSTVIFLPGVAEKLSRVFNSDLIIAFTSVHEAMVHSVNGNLSPADIREVISLPEFTEGPDYLSDKVYIYDRDRDEISEFIEIGEEDVLYGEKIMWDMHSSQTPICYRQ